MNRLDDIITDKYGNTYTPELFQAKVHALMERLRQVIIEEDNSIAEPVVVMDALLGMVVTLLANISGGAMDQQANYQITCEVMDSIFARVRQARERKN